MLNELPDGTRFEVRYIRPDDKPRLAEALTHLSPQSIYRRFLSPKPRFTSSELRYLTEVDGHDHLALVALPADDPGCIVAVARYVRHEGDPHAAEAAVVVGDSFQGRGLGKLLALRLADEAAAHGIRRLTATILAENVPARRLMAAISERLERGPLAGPAQELSVDLPQAA